MKTTAFLFLLLAAAITGTARTFAACLLKIERIFHRIKRSLRSCRQLGCTACEQKASCRWVTPPDKDSLQGSV